MNYQCSQQLFSLLTALLRRGEMRDGCAVERDRNACRRGYLENGSYEIENSVPGIKIRCLLDNKS
jgi:hypothetical protein